MNYTLEEIEELTLDEVRAIAGPVEELPGLFDNYPDPNSTEPFRGDVPEIGSWRYDNVTGYEVCIDLPVADLVQTEYDLKDGWAPPRNLALYTDWWRQGYVAPPPAVVRNVSGSLVSVNSRRVLAAQLAGIETMRCWFSATTDDGGIKWRDIK